MASRDRRSPPRSRPPAPRRSPPPARRAPSALGGSAQLPVRLWADSLGHARALCGTRGQKSFVLGVSVSAADWRREDEPVSTR